MLSPTASSSVDCVIGSYNGSAREGDAGLAINDWWKLAALLK